MLALMRTTLARFSFATLHPSPKMEKDIAANEAVFANGSQVQGVEVSVPALAARCTLGNIDPQHTGGDANTAAIEAAFAAQLPPEGATLATVRADLDAVGAMVVLVARVAGIDLTPATERIALVAAADKFARGGWPGVQDLPSAANPWPEGGSARELASIGSAIADFKTLYSDRVATMAAWLLTGEEPANYRALAERERAVLVAAITRDEIKVDLVASGRIAIVESSHRAGTMLGYMRAPVVVAFDRKFRLSGGEPHLKFTVCQYKAGYADLVAALAKLRVLEPGWGGSPTLVASTQGVSSPLTPAQVIEVVVKYLK